MNQHLLVTVFFFGLLLVILYAVFLILSPFLVPITWAAILAVVVYPLYGWLVRRLRGGPNLAAFIITILLTLVIVLPAIKLAGFLSQEAVELVNVVRNLANRPETELWKEKPWIKDLLGFWDWASINLAAFEIDLKEAAIQGAQVSSGFIVSHVKDIAQNVFVFTINIFVALLTFFFFLRDGKHFCERIRRLLPMDPQHQNRLFRNIVDSIYAVIHGCVVVAMVQGLLAGLAYWALGIPFSVLWGVATAFLALLPVGGSTLVSLPLSLYLFLQDSYLKGIILLAWSLGIVGTIDNFLKPVFIGSRLRLPVLFLFFSILGGLSLFGAVGLILGPVLFALLAALLDLYLDVYAKGSTTETGI